MIYVGVLVVRVHGLPTYFGRDPRQARLKLPPASLRWLDQYSTLGLVLVGLGAAVLAVGLV